MPLFVRRDWLAGVRCLLFTQQASREFLKEWQSFTKFCEKYLRSLLTVKVLRRLSRQDSLVGEGWGLGICIFTALWGYQCSPSFREDVWNCPGHPRAQPSPLGGLTWASYHSGWTWGLARWERRQERECILNRWAEVRCLTVEPASSFLIK